MTSTTPCPGFPLGPETDAFVVVDAATAASGGGRDVVSGGGGGRLARQGAPRVFPQGPAR